VLKILSRSIRVGNRTKRDPFDEEPPHAFPVVDFAACTACGTCSTGCPSGALRIDRGAKGHVAVSLSLCACTQCRECVALCPTGAIGLGRATGLAAYTKDQLTSRGSFEVAEGRDHLTFQGMETLSGPSVEETGKRLRERIRGALRRSLHVRQVDAGSCNGCELEIAATANPVFDLERFGIHFVASPRHADLLLVTGPVTRNMEIALARTYEATPEPRVVVAVGACGCTGGLFGEGTYAVRGGVDRILPVDLFIPGCPPRPQAILYGLLVAMDLRDARTHPL
jgi:Ni,Fe-hydrogenase III small subunit/formate hydrogenlyase subunit 6/NADH:ubiquinone oxidoreductase subunit I